MKWTASIFLSLLPFFCCGCVTLASHTKKADKATATYARGVTDIIQRVHGDSADLGYQIQLLEHETQQLEEVAKEDPGFRIPPQAISGIASIIAMVTGPGCLVGAGLGLKKMIECNNMRGLVKDLTEMNPTESKAHAIKHKVMV